MEELECEPSSQVVIEASISSIGRPEKNNNAPTPLCSDVLTRIHAGYFRISISLGSQALLWKVLTQPNGVSPDGFSGLPSTAEFLNHIGVNYLYAPWISWLILLQSAPVLLPITSLVYPILCWTFIVPLVMLDIKIYGQWFTTEKRFLSVMANPTSQISVIGNLVATWAAAEMGWKESAVCMWSLGMVHYLVLFVTLYQRLSGRNSLPTILRPTFFLFFAAPSMASLAWNSITGAFDYTSKMLFFFSMFLFVSLVCRPFLFKKSMKKFNVAWWAYSFPVTFIALAAVQYAGEVKSHVATLLMLGLSTISVLVFLGLTLLTAANMYWLWRDTDDPLLNFSIKPKSSA
ncbi:hypothetical protein V6N13_062843 [Hibiscus sabdariffa]|uniref:Uncharacterized protein n=1 Tax=Hibiscus sabdariffa TaxID=183260 RepID=A0ABR2ND34_9ROSI